MKLNLYSSIADSYQNNSQKIRVLTEDWVGEYIFCPSCMPDIENMQVIGFSVGKDNKEAFDNLLIKSQYLKNTSFNELIAFELVDGKQDVFTIQD